MINKLLKLLFGDKSEKDIKEITPYVDKTLAEHAKLSSISNDELRAKTSHFKQKIRDYIKVEIDVIAETKKKADSPSTPFTDKDALFTEIERLEKEADKKTEEILLEILPEAFAVIKETARRLSENGQIDVTATDLDKTYAAKYPHIIIEGDKAIWKNTWDAAGTEVVWNMVHYNVQLIGGTAMHMGKIAEMSTGEGKTLVATLPVYLNALTGKGVHIVTVNDYLAKRDSEWMGPLYQFHGLTVDCIDKHQPNTEERRNAYNADITFGTNNEFGFDYLRDNMVGSVDQMVQRKHHYAIIDEVDSVLIDDARTPLIISGPTPNGDKHEFHELKPKIQRLVDAQRKVVTTFLTDAKKNLFALNGDDNGKSKKEISTMLDEGGVALLRAYRGLPKNKALIKYLSESGIKAHLQKTENFYMQDQSKEMHKIDKDLYFVIDEKNNQIELTEKGIDLISGNEDPSFYIMPDIGSEMAEIERSSAPSEDKLKRKDALMRDYTIKAERIHSINQLLKAYTLFEADVEYVIMDNKIKIVDEQTGRIMDGRRYSDGLHQAIEAKENVTVEAATQTYATVTLQNYFRMYHKLSGMTGTAETEAKEFWDIYKLDVVTIPTNRPISRKDHDDLVYKTGREKYNAVIDEIEKLVKLGRPVLVGTTSVEISELLSRMLKMKKISHNVLNAKLHQKEAEIVAEAGKPGTVTIATNMAGRGTDIKLGEGVKEAGGLAIIGTERHDSRRVDRQLRGRAGRQGDPGSSQFFVSLEDNLMRLFGSERIAKMMDRLGHKEGEVIQAGMISKSIERAQKKVEENNFGIRKRLLEYDDVMNSQRSAIYKKRRNALFGDKLDLDVDTMFYEAAESIVVEHHNNRDFEGFVMDLIKYFSIDTKLDEDGFLKADVNKLIDEVYTEAKKHYTDKCEQIRQMALPVVKNVYETQSSSFKNIVIPFTDGHRSIRMVADLKESYEKEGNNISKLLEKNVMLGIIDDEWKEHLREMVDLRQSVQQAVYEQKDPLLIYKLESYDLFKQMLDRTNKEVLSFITKVFLLVNPDENVGRKTQQIDGGKTDVSKLKTQKDDIGSATQQNQNVAAQEQGRVVKQQPIVSEKKHGRNDKVKVLNLQNGETKELKFKQAEELINTGTWQLIEE